MRSQKAILQPPLWIRGLLILTCTGVSFAHGSNDGQKGMGLIMLILIGIVPTAYALNHAVTKRQSQDFIAVSEQAASTLDKYVSPNAVIADAREDVTAFIRTREFTPNTMLALRQLVSDIGNETVLFGELAKVPNDRVRNFRNDMYLVSEALRLMQKTHQPDIAAADWQVLTNYKKHIDNATKFIPGWVKVAVAMALGLGTMVGWKRIVVTVGEKIGKDHLTYGQGAAAEITAMFTIGAADWFGLPVSTTHVLSSGIAGTMAANHTGLQWATVRNLLMAWVLTLAGVDDAGGLPVLGVPEHLLTQSCAKREPCSARFLSTVVTDWRGSGWTKSLLRGHPGSRRAARRWADHGSAAWRLRQ